METSDDLHTFTELNEFSIIESSPNKRFFKTNHVLEKLHDKILFLALDNESGKEMTWHSIKVPNTETPEPELKALKFNKVSHPNILEIFEFWKNNDKEIVIISEFVNCSLKGFVNNSRERPRKSVLKKWAKSILLSLDYFHSKNHNKTLLEPKYENIFINSTNGEVKIHDFNFHSKFCQKNTSSKPDFNISTPLNPLEKDLFSLGSLIIEFLSNSSSANNSKSKSKSKKPFPDYSDDPDIKTFISKCISSKVEKITISHLLNTQLMTESDSDRPEKLIQNPYNKLKDISIDHISKRNHTIKLLTQDLTKEKTNIEYKFNIKKTVPEKLADDLLQLSHINPAELFKILNKLDESTNYPYKPPEQKTPYFRANIDNMIKFSLKLKIEDIEAIRYVKVDVNYFPEKDSPETLTSKILQDFDLDKENYSDILSIVCSKLDDFSFSNDCAVSPLDFHSLKRRNSKPHDSTSESLNIGRWSLESLNEPFPDIIHN